MIVGKMYSMIFFPPKTNVTVHKNEKGTSFRWRASGRIQNYMDIDALNYMLGQSFMGSRFKRWVYGISQNWGTSPAPPKQTQCQQRNSWLLISVLQNKQHAHSMKIQGWHLITACLQCHHQFVIRFDMFIGCLRRHRHSGGGRRTCMIAVLSVHRSDYDKSKTNKSH